MAGGDLYGTADSTVLGMHYGCEKQDDEDHANNRDDAPDHGAEAEPLPLAPGEMLPAAPVNKEELLSVLKCHAQSSGVWHSVITLKLTQTCEHLGQSFLLYPLHPLMLREDLVGRIL